MEGEGKGREEGEGRRLDWKGDVLGGEELTYLWSKHREALEVVVCPVQHYGRVLRWRNG